MTTPRYLTVTYCARPECGALETAHEIRANGTRGKRYAMTAGATDSVACPGWIPGRVEERPDEGELRRRLDAVLALPLWEPALPYPDPDQQAAWMAGYTAALSAATRAARGES